MTEEGNMMKLKDVQIALGVSRVTLRRWIKDGKVAAVKVGAHWRVQESVVQRLKEEGSR